MPCPPLALAFRAEADWGAGGEASQDARFDAARHLRLATIGQQHDVLAGTYLLAGLCKPPHHARLYRYRQLSFPKQRNTRLLCLLLYAQGCRSGSKFVALRSEVGHEQAKPVFGLGGCGAVVGGVTGEHTGKRGVALSLCAAAPVSGSAQLCLRHRGAAAGGVQGSPRLNAACGERCASA